MYFANDGCGEDRTFLCQPRCSETNRSRLMIMMVSVLVALVRWHYP